MNYKVFTIIALVFMLALAVPASAVWSNGNWVSGDKSDEYFGNSDVKYDPVTGVLSKYSAPEDVNLMTTQGMVIGNLKSGGTLDGGARFLFHRVGTDVNKTLAQSFGPDGQYTGYLVPGEYDVILPQGTGSACGIYSDDLGYVGNPHEERTRITVVAGQKTYFSFIGNSIPTGLGTPKDATINVGLGHGDVRLNWVKLVKTGQHWVPPMPYQHCEQVMTHAAYDDPAYYTVVPASSHQECEWHWWGNDCHTVYEGNCKKVYGGNYDFMIGSQKYKFENHGNYQYTYHAPVHHDAVYETVCHTDTVPGHMVPEYGLEYFLEIDGYRANIENPNTDPVNVEFVFDLNYFIDKRPWDNVVDDGRVVKRTKTINGNVEFVEGGVTTYHGTITPDVDNAVAVFDWQHGMRYIPTISNARVTSTQWT